MSTPKVPQDRSLRASRIAREHGQDSDLSAEQIKDLILSEGIDDSTAAEAVNAVMEDRKSRWEAFDKYRGFAILVCIAAVLIAAAQRELLFLGLVPLAGLFALIQYPWGWRRPR